MDRANAEEFFEVYKGVVTEYSVSINTTLLCHHVKHLHHNLLLHVSIVRYLLRCPLSRTVTSQWLLSVEFLISFKIHNLNWNFAPSLQNMVTELCSGPCMVLEVCGTDVPRSFREFCGPADPVSQIYSVFNLIIFLYWKLKVERKMMTQPTFFEVFPNDFIVKFSQQQKITLKFNFNMQSTIRLLGTC